MPDANVVEELADEQNDCNKTSETCFVFSPCCSGCSSALAALLNVKAWLFVLGVAYAKYQLVETNCRPLFWHVLYLQLFQTVGLYSKQFLYYLPWFICLTWYAILNPSSLMTVPLFEKGGLEGGVFND